MKTMIFGSPGRYFQGHGLLDNMNEILHPFASQRIALISDSFIGPKLEDRLRPQILAGNAKFAAHFLDGDLTYAAIAKLVAALEDFKPDLVIAAGGGRGIDAGKSVAKHFDTRLVTLPTAASTDSPTSKNFVIYDEQHQMAGVEHLPRNPDAVVVSLDMLCQAPADLMRFGIGDAISKKFEARQCFKVSGNNMFGARPSRAALALSEICFDTLICYAEDALATAGTGQCTEAFEAVCEANMLLAGLAFESGGLSVAHGLSRGLALYPGVVDTPHGYQVSFGLMVQLSLEREGAADYKFLWNWLGKIGLPRTLKELGASLPDEDIQKRAANQILSSPHLQNFERKLTADEIVNAIRNISAP